MNEWRQERTSDGLRVTRTTVAGAVLIGIHLDNGRVLKMSEAAYAAREARLTQVSDQEMKELATAAILSRAADVDLQVITAMARNYLGKDISSEDARSIWNLMYRAQIQVTFPQEA